MWPNPQETGTTKPQNLHTRKSRAITVFYAVILQMTVPPWEEHPKQISFLIFQKHI